MPKIPDCNRCQFYTHALHFVCQVHPMGVETLSCLDFRPHPQLHPLGTYYDGHFLRFPELTPEQRFQAQLIKTYPRLSKCCSRCGGKFSLIMLWCRDCGWTNAETF